MGTKTLSLSRVIDEWTTSINDTLSLFKNPAPEGGKKVEKKEVIAATDVLARQATTAGVLWNGKVSRKEGLENVNSFCQALQGLLLLCHGSSVGAGPTLMSYFTIAAKQVASGSLNLMRGVVGKSGLSSQEKTDIPVLVGLVWEACEGIKKIPSNNHVAVGRSLTQVAVSIKDVLREMDDFRLKSESNPVTGEGNDQNDSQHGTDDEASSSDENGELSEDLSATEMQVVQSVREYVSLLLNVLKQLMYIVADASKLYKDVVGVEDPILVLEKLLKLSKDVGVMVDELGASLYPPQEIDELQERATEVQSLIENMKLEVCSLVGSLPEGFVAAVDASKMSGLALMKVLQACSDE